MEPALAPERHRPLPLRWMLGPLAVLALLGAAAPALSQDDGGRAVLTRAERVADLRQVIQEDEERLAELRTEASGDEESVERARTDFEAARDERARLERELEELRAQGNAAAVEERAAAHDAATKNHDLARERLDLALEAQETRRGKIATLAAKLENQHQVLAVLEGRAVSLEPAPATPPATVAAEEEVAPPFDLPGVPALPALEEPPAEDDTLGTQAAEEARQMAQRAAATVRSANERVRRLGLSLDRLDELIAAERRSAELARRQGENARQEIATLEQEDVGLARTPEEVAARLGDARTRLEEATREEQDASDRLLELEAQRAELGRLALAAAGRLAESRELLQAAERRVWWAESPFHPEHLKLWAVVHGPKVVVILIGMLLLRWLVAIASRRIAARVGYRKREAETERNWRAETLVTVFRAAASVTILIVGMLLILQEFSVPIGPVLGGAAVVGLAVAFGAQTLIRDVFYGFFILLENQYSINDVVKIAGLGGLVERITLRMTVLRDQDGTVHFIPNGQITTVSNMTHGWSRATFDIRVSYRDDVEQVMAALVEIGREMRREPAFQRVILDDPEMLGVDAVDETSLIVKLLIKTRPLHQWTVKREYLRRMKKRFDEAGFEFPYPRRLVHQRFEGEDGQERPEGRPPAPA